MLILALKAGHDGSIAVVEDGRLLLSLEGEKDSFRRYISLQATSLFDVAERVGAVPDVVAMSGWRKSGVLTGQTKIGGGYGGAHTAVQWPTRFYGKEVTYFTDSHERSHILGSIGMAPRDDASSRAVLVWEGSIGKIYVVDSSWTVTKEVPVLSTPGTRYSSLFAIADPNTGDHAPPAYDHAGKLMALAAFGDATRVEPEVAATVDALVSDQLVGHKIRWRDSPLYNIGVEAQEAKDAAALITDRLFEIYARAVHEHIPEGLPLHIGGGCGLNCEWNARWRNLGHFSSVFVPPCTNDSGAGIGTAIDAQAALTGEAHIEWTVYSGLDFIEDATPDPARWQRAPLAYDGVAQALDEERVFAWVQGRWEIGPRALGNRSLLAEPSNPRTKDRLNEIKQREDYRPVAPCCRIEDLTKAFVDDLEDPYMLYFNRSRSGDLAAVTHVDGTARVQTVRKESNEPLHRLLSAFAERRGLGVLCNTSLNFRGMGFINRMADLIAYCEARGVDDMVVGDAWYRRVAPS
jgi:hydroxymethyl cephem carbamoyltransferase